jgi:hypothetical protein
MSDPNETANLIGQLAQGYREHLAEECGPQIATVPGRVLGGDIEGAADALADDASRPVGLLAAFAQEPGQRSLDAIAVYRPTEPGHGVDGGRGHRTAPPGMGHPR